MILDDILSGLDPTTEQTLFNALFGPEGICRRQGITVVLATNAGWFSLSFPPFSRLKTFFSNECHQVHRLSSADHIIALGSTGEILEQGTFEELNANGSAGYVYSLSLSSRAVTEASLNKEDETAQAIMTSVEESAKKEPEDDGSDGNGRRTGDLTVYKYYIETIGWGSWCIFVSLCCAYGFGSVFPRKYILYFSFSMIYVWYDRSFSRPNSFHQKTARN